MATKSLEAWKKEAQALAKKIGKEPIEFSEGVKVEEVEKIVEGLSAELKAAQDAIDSAAKNKKPAVAFEFYVADGKSITARRGRKGMCHAGDEIKADFLGGGLKALESLIKKGVVIKNASYKK